MIRLMDRVATFKSFIDKKPDDPFPRYGLAMEYRNTGKYKQAQAVFDALLEKFPDYLAAYLMAGDNLVSLEHPDDARKVYQDGIKTALKHNDDHTKSELEAALAALG